MKLTDELQVFTHQGKRSAGRSDNVVLAHAGGEAEMHTAQVLDIVFDLAGAVKRFFGDLAGGLLLNQAFVADDAFVGDGSAHVVDGAAAGNGFAGGVFVSEDDAGDGVDGEVEEQGNVGHGEQAALGMGLAKQA